MAQQHMHHEATRYAAEVIERDGRDYKVRGGVMPQGSAPMPGLRPSGSIAYASVYSQGIHESREKPKRAWSVEVLHRSGHWITAGKGVQGRTIDEAKNLVRGHAGYRIITTGCNGGEIVVRG